jgi:SAM-dependent methyltransferase
VDELCRCVPGAEAPAAIASRRREFTTFILFNSYVIILPSQLRSYAFTRLRVKFRFPGALILSFRATVQRIWLFGIHTLARLVRAARGREWRSHPIDEVYRIETSGRLGRREISSGTGSDPHNVGYAGAQPSILRQCLALIPQTDGSFVDLGCGKGRMLAVASEFGFSSIVGIEISPLVVGIARRNAETIRKRHPDRTAITVVEGDATKPNLPTNGVVVLFFYNSFRRPLVEALVRSLEAHCASHPNCKLWFVAYNPVNHSVFDDSPLFERFLAGQFEYEPDEKLVTSIGNTSDSVVVYQSRNGYRFPALRGAAASIAITIPDLNAIVQSIF